jgi:hypothetical protein
MTPLWLRNIKSKSRRRSQRPVVVPQAEDAQFIARVKSGWAKKEGKTK